MLFEEACGAELDGALVEVDFVWDEANEGEEGVLETFAHVILHEESRGKEVGDESG